ncbi:hypothetical protein [Elioraea rosea]|uniref:hypothetical protein n=1 Tax=Elioraea rosea TaxID=2492390 RepID=UPI0011845FC0|nr:hypothetical protein [Elioraea rosea]
MIGGIFAPEGGWVVRIRDLSADDPSAPEAVEDVPGFSSLMHANAFARRYVRDSLERCRVPGATPEEVAADWHAFGEDAEVADAAEAGWKSASELSHFAAHPVAPDDEERDWRSLDPRRDDGEEDDDEDGEGGEPGEGE